MRLIVVSGLSGSGKSVALATLEDCNDYCVDNLPLGLLPAFAEELLTHQRPSLETAAVGIDARNFRDQLERFPDIVAQLRAARFEVDIVFLQADAETLLKRFSDTRRPHPLSVEHGTPLPEAIEAERRLLAPIAAHATLVIDTSHTNLHELRELLRTRLHGGEIGQLSLVFESFGFKNGLPDDADYVFDVRFLPNPHWQSALRPLTGRDEAVARFLEAHEVVESAVADLIRFLETWLPAFETGSRSYLTVAVGCTGGQHRSVYVTERLARHFGATRRAVSVRHRELS